MNYILLGVPGAGKGTQAELITKKFGFVHVSTGNIFREILNSDNELKGIIEGYMSKGALVPDEIVMKTVEYKIGGCKDNFLFDGFPRNLNQAKLLDKYLNSKNCSVTMTIYLDLSYDASIRRLTARRVCPKCKSNYNMITMPPSKDELCDKCGAKITLRPDDNIDTVKERLKVYEAETMPLVAYYKKQGKLVSIGADNAVEKIFENIEKRIKQGS